MQRWNFALWHFDSVGHREKHSKITIYASGVFNHTCVAFNTGTRTCHLFCPSAHPEVSQAAQTENGKQYFSNFVTNPCQSSSLHCSTHAPDCSYGAACRPRLSKRATERRGQIEGCCSAARHCCQPNTHTKKTNHRAPWTALLISRSRCAGHRTQRATKTSTAAE